MELQNMNMNIDIIDINYCNASNIGKIKKALN